MEFTEWTLLPSLWHLKTKFFDCALAPFAAKKTREVIGKEPQLEKRGERDGKIKMMTRWERNIGEESGEEYTWGWERRRNIYSREGCRFNFIKMIRGKKRKIRRGKNWKGKVHSKREEKQLQACMLKKCKQENT